MRASSLVICALVARASADPATADKAAADAKAAAANNDFVTAAVKFREAYAADPRPELMCNVGIAYYKAKDLPRAELYIDQCEAIGKGLEKAFLTNVAQVHQALNAKLAADKFTPVDLAVEPQSATTTVDGGVPFDQPIVGSHRLWFPFGHYRLTIHADGYVDHPLELVLSSRAPSPQRIALDRAPVIDAGSGAGSSAGSAAEAVGSASVGSAAGSSAGSSAGGTPPHVAVLHHRSYTPPSIATSITGGIALASLGFWVVAKTFASDAEHQQDPSQYLDDVAGAHRWQNIAWYGVAAAGIGGLVSGYLWYRAVHGTRVELQPTASGAAVSFTGRW